MAFAVLFLLQLLTDCDTISHWIIFSAPFLLRGSEVLCRLEFPIFLEELLILPMSVSGVPEAGMSRFDGPEDKFIVVTKGAYFDN